MATNFPSSLDTSATLPVETAGTALATNHIPSHQNLTDSVIALETKVGINSSAVTTTHDYKLSLITGSNKAVPNASPTITGTVTLDTLQASSTAGITLKNNSGSTAISCGGSGTVASSAHGQFSANVDSTDYQVFTGGTGTITHTATGGSATININLVPKGSGRVQSNAVNIPTVSSTDTLTNKRITARVFSEASNATPTPASDSYDQHNVTALAAGATFGAPTGTPTDGQNLIIRVKDNGTARTLAFNAIYRASSDLPLPTTTILSKTLYLGFKYNSADSKWDLLAVLNNF